MWLLCWRLQQPPPNPLCATPPSTTLCSLAHGIRCMDCAHDTAHRLTLLLAPLVVLIAGKLATPKRTLVDKLLPKTAVKGAIEVGVRLECI
jgi:hypothetical protein